MLVISNQKGRLQWTTISSRPLQGEEFVLLTSKGTHEHTLGKAQCTFKSMNFTCR